MNRPLKWSSRTRNVGAEPIQWFTRQASRRAAPETPGQGKEEELAGSREQLEKEIDMYRTSWDRDREGRRLSAGAYFVLLDTGTEQVRLKAVVR